MNNFMLAAFAADKPWNVHSYLVSACGLDETVLYIAAIALCIIIPYLLGSVNPAIIFSKMIFNDDIRTHGSGNAGTTNTLRTYGKKMAGLILLLDFLKAVIAVEIGTLILTREIGGAIAGLFVIIGHTFPIYYKFKGGKGVASLSGVVLMLSPIPFAILIVFFIATVVVTRYVSLGSVLGVILLAVLQPIFYPDKLYISISCALIALLIVFMHRANIKRLLSGKESKISFKSKEKRNGGGNDGK